MKHDADLSHLHSTIRRLHSDVPATKEAGSEKFRTLLFLPEINNRIDQGGLRLNGKFKKNSETVPLISIVTIVYNGAMHLEETILSVLNQSYDNVEYIIIDGGSTDNTLDIIRKYEASIDYWVSESDTGISDAFNKGIQCCTGQLVGLINSDDYYAPDALEHIKNHYVSGNSFSVIYGKTLRLTLDRKILIKKNNSLGWHVSVPFSHCSSFLTISYYKRFGLFDQNFKIAMDVDLLMRGLNMVNYKEIDYVIATQRDGGVSDRMRLNGYFEYFKISNKRFGPILSCFGYLLKMVMFLRNKVLR